MSIALKPLNQQVIVITGASSGIGLTTALSAAHQGAQLVLAARSADTPSPIAAALSEQGTQLISVKADVGDRGDVENVAAEAVKRFGRIDTRVNDGGVSINARAARSAEMP